MPGAAEAGSWGGGGGTGGISTGRFGACGGLSSVEVGSPGVVAVLREGLAGLDGAGAEVGVGGRVIEEVKKDEEEEKR